MDDRSPDLKSVAMDLGLVKEAEITLPGDDARALEAWRKQRGLTGERENTQPELDFGTAPADRGYGRNR